MRLRKGLRPAGDRGSGSVLAVALVASVLALTSLALPLYVAVVAKRTVSAAADAAALAAADVAVGIRPGYPCVEAARVAVANGSTLSACEVDGLVVTVAATAIAAGFPVMAVATAGPALGEAD